MSYMRRLQKEEEKKEKELKRSGSNGHAQHYASNQRLRREASVGNFYNSLANPNSVSQKEQLANSSSTNANMSPINKAVGSSTSLHKPMTVGDRFALHADVSNQAAQQQLVSNSSLSRSPTLSTMTRIHSGIHLAAVTPLRAPPLPHPSVDMKPTATSNGTPIVHHSNLYPTNQSPSPTRTANTTTTTSTPLSHQGPQRNVTSTTTTTTTTTHKQLGASGLSPAALPPKPFRRPMPDDDLLNVQVHNINSLAPGVYSSGAKKPPSRGLGGGAFSPSLPVRMERSAATGHMHAITRDSDDEADHGLDGAEEVEEDSIIANNISFVIPPIPLQFGGANQPGGGDAPPLSGSDTQLQGLLSFRSEVSGRSNMSPKVTSTPNGLAPAKAVSFGGAAGRHHAQHLLSPNPQLSVSQQPGPSTSGIPIVLQKTFRLQAIAYTNPVVALFRDKQRAPPLSLVEEAVKGNRHNLLQPHQFYQWCVRVLWMDNPNFYRGVAEPRSLHSAKAEANSGGGSPKKGSDGSGGNNNDNANSVSNNRSIRVGLRGDESLEGSLSPHAQNSPAAAAAALKAQQAAEMNSSKNRTRMIGDAGSYFKKRSDAKGDHTYTEVPKFSVSDEHDKLYQTIPAEAPSALRHKHPKSGLGAPEDVSRGLNKTPTRQVGKHASSQNNAPQSSATSAYDANSDDNGGHAGPDATLLDSDIAAVQRLSTPSHHMRARAKAMHKANEQRQVGRKDKKASNGPASNGGLHNAFSPLFTSPEGPTQRHMTPNMVQKRERSSVANTNNPTPALLSNAASTLVPPISTSRQSISGKMTSNGNSLGVTPSMSRRGTVAGEGRRSTMVTPMPQPAIVTPQSDSDSDSVVSACSNDFDTVPCSVKAAVTMASKKAPPPSYALAYDANLREIIESVGDSNERVQMLNSLANFRRTHFLALQFEKGFNATATYVNSSANDGADVFANAMEHFCTTVPFTRAAVQQLFQLLDANDDGVLEHREMCDGMIHLLSVDGPLMPLLHRFQTLVEPKFKRDVRLVRISRQELVLFSEAVVAVLLRQLRGKIRRRERFINHYRLSGVLFPADEPPSLGRRRIGTFQDNDMTKRAAAATSKGHKVVTKEDGSIIIIKDMPPPLPVARPAMSARWHQGGDAEEEGGSEEAEGTNTDAATPPATGTRAPASRGATLAAIKTPTAGVCRSRHHRRSMPLPKITAPFDALKAKKQYLVRYQAAKQTGGARLDTRQKLSDFMLPENENAFHELPSTQWFLLMDAKYGAGASNPFNTNFSLENEKGNNANTDMKEMLRLQREVEEKVDARRRKEMVELGKVAALRKDMFRNAMQRRLEQAAEVCPSSSLLTYLVALKERDSQRVMGGMKAHPSTLVTVANPQSTANPPSDDPSAVAEANAAAAAAEWSDHDDYEIDLPLTSLHTLMAPSAVDARIAQRHRKPKPLPRYMASTKASASALTKAATASSAQPSQGQGPDDHQATPSSAPAVSHEFLLEGVDKDKRGPVPDTPSVRAVLNYLDTQLTLPIRLLEQTIRRFYIDFDQHILSLIGTEPVSYKVIQDVLQGSNSNSEASGGDLTSAVATVASASPLATMSSPPEDTPAAIDKRRADNRFAAKIASSAPTPMVNHADSFISSQSLNYSRVSLDTGGAADEINKYYTTFSNSVEGNPNALTNPTMPYIRAIAQKYFVGRLPFERALRESFLSYYYRELDADEGETMFKPMRQQLQHPTLERIGNSNVSSAKDANANPASNYNSNTTNNSNNGKGGVSSPVVTPVPNVTFSANINGSNPLVLVAGSSSPHKGSGDGSDEGKRQGHMPTLTFSSVNANSFDANRRTLFNPDSPRGTLSPPMAGSPTGTRLPAINTTNSGGSPANTGEGQPNSFANVGMLSGGGGKVATSTFFARRKTTAPNIGRAAEEYTDTEFVVHEGRVVVRPRVEKGSRAMSPKVAMTPEPRF